MQNFASRRSSSKTYSSNLLKLVAKGRSPSGEETADLRSPLFTDDSGRAKEPVADPKTLFKDLFMKRVSVPGDPDAVPDAPQLRKHEFRTLLNEYLKIDAKNGRSKDWSASSRRVFGRSEVGKASFDIQREKISLDNKAILESVTESEAKESTLPFVLGSGPTPSHQTAIVAKDSFAGPSQEAVPTNPLRMNSILKTQASINASLKGSTKWSNHRKNVVFAAESAPVKSDKGSKKRGKEHCLICC